MLFVCLLATISSAFEPSVNYPWDNQLTWNTDNTDANWYAPANWSDSTCPPDGPGLNNEVVIMPMVPGPQITGDASCAMLMYNGWDPTVYGAKDAVVTLDPNAGNCNFGATIQLNSWVDYDSYLGTTALASRAILNVYGGTITTPTHPSNQTNLCGIHIGGGASNYALAYGMLNIYGGLVNVPRIELHFGEIGLYGGTLHLEKTGGDDFADDGNFVVTTDHPEATLNKIRIDGGTFILDGDKTAILSALIASGTVVCDRGTLGTPTYDTGADRTTITADINYCVWDPQPANNATNVHYYNSDGNSITLSWQESTLNPIDANDDVYFGTSFADVCNATKASPEYKGTRYDITGYDVNGDPYGDPCSWTITAFNFLPNTSYYWRIDEINNVNVVNKGLVWTFKTHDGKAYNPKPANESASGLNADLKLSWTAGDFTQPTSGHQVFFGTSFTTVNNAKTTHTDGRYRGTVSEPNYPLTRLLETAPGGSFVLNTGQTYYWRIDEVNGVSVLKGPIWSFTPAAYINIDDFEDSRSTDDVNANWPDHYQVTGCTTLTGNAKRILIRDASGKYMRYTYNNSGTNPAFGTMAFSEAKRRYSGGTSLTGGGVISPAPKALRIDYRGTATNVVTPLDSENPDPNADTMYVAIEDTAGNVSVYLNPDHAAQQVGNWTSWYTSLTDINATGTPNPANLNAITGFAIGFGVRCTNWAPYFDGVDTNSNVMFDNIRLYAATCVSQYGPTADLDGDCDVDINDMDLLATDWLQRAENYVFSPCTQPAKAPILWYKFNEAGQTAEVIDYGTGDSNNYTGTVANWITTNWKVGYGRDGNNCLYLPPGGNCYVTAPVGTNPLGNVMGFMRDAAHTASYSGFTGPGGGGVTFSVWINADMTNESMLTSWNGLFDVWGGPSAPVAQISVFCPAPNADLTCAFLKLDPAITANAFNRNSSDYGGRWNHFCFVKDYNSMQIYINGRLGVPGRIDANGLTGDPNVNAYGPLFDPNVTSLGIGTRSSGAAYPNWGMWIGYLQDFRVYDYALSPAEVGWLATDGVGQVFLPLISPANINADGSTSPATDPNQIVNFGDMAVMETQWLLYHDTPLLWP
jgi:hypothetical protein